MTQRKRWRKKAPRDPNNKPITQGCLVRLLRDVRLADGSTLRRGHVARVLGVGYSGYSAAGVTGLRFDDAEVVPKGTRIGPPPSFGDRLRTAGERLWEMLR